MEQSLSTPKSLMEFKKRDEEVQVFEGFKETEPSIHSGFKEPTRFDEQKVEFRTIAPRRDTEALRRRLLSTFSGNTGEADLKVQAETLDWDGLIELYAEMITENDRAKSKDSPLRNSFKKNDSLPSTLHSLTEMIPDDKGLSVLRVGLAYIFLAWKRHIETRNRVLDALAEVPKLLARVYDKRVPYRGDQALSILIEDFHAVLLHSLIRLAEFISPSQEHKKPWVKRAWRKLSEQESKEIDDITSQISASMTRIDERVEQLLHQRLANVEKIGYCSYGELQASRQLHNENSGHLQQILASLQQLNIQLSQDASTRTQPSQPMMNFRDNVFFMITPDMASVMQTGLYNIVSEDRYIEQYQLWPETSRIARSRTPVMELLPVTNEELVRILRIQETDPSAEVDMKYVLRRANSMQERGLSQARSLMTKDSFKNLIAKDESGILMVNGHCKEDGAGKTSPLSVWSASFAASLMQSDSVVVLHYFCGLHSRSIAGGPPAGPLGLVKSLIEQLVRQAGDNVARMGPLDKTLAQKVEENSFDAMLSLLKPLLMSLDTAKTVFIIIDNASEFESVTWNEWSEHMVQIFKALYDIVRDQTSDSGPRMRLKVKLLMTNANKSTTLAGQVDEGEIVSLY